MITTESAARKTLWGSEDEHGLIPDLLHLLREVPATEELLKDLLPLLHGEPTTAELIEALKVARVLEHAVRALPFPRENLSPVVKQINLIQSTLRTWISSRNICGAAEHVITRRTA